MSACARMWKEPYKEKVVLTFLTIEGLMVERCGALLFGLASQGAAAYTF